MAGINFKAFDLGGHEIARRVWKDYYAQVRAAGWADHWEEHCYASGFHYPDTQQSLLTEGERERQTDRRPMQTAFSPS